MRNPGNALCGLPGAILTLSRSTLAPLAEVLESPAAINSGDVATPFELTLAEADSGNDPAVGSFVHEALERRMLGKEDCGTRDYRQAPDYQRREGNPGMAGSCENPHRFDLLGGRRGLARSGYRHRHEAIVHAG